jgi:hypothetical protein
MPIPRGKKGTILVSLAKNETESFQLIVTPKEDIPVKVSITSQQSDLEVQCFKVGFVQTVSGEIPDSLEECGPQRPGSGHNAIFWIRIKTSRNSLPGERNIYLTVNDKDKFLVKTRIFNFVLPEHPSVKTIGRIWWTKEIADDIKLTSLYENLSEHLVFNGGYAIPGPFVHYDEDRKKLSIDFREFDKTADDLIRRLNYEGFFVPYFFGNWNGLVNEKWLDKIPVLSSDFERFFGEYCAQLAEHLKKMGWLEKVYIQPWDEPQQKDIDKVARIARIVRANAPGLKIFVASALKKELFGLVDAWSVPLSTKYIDPRQIRARQSRGDEVWGYQNYNYNLLSPPLNMRLLPWVAKKYGLQGIEWWAINHWDKYFGHNSGLEEGNGFFLYSSTGINRKPINSIRWELYRKGLEDVEYITLYERKKGNTSASWILDQIIKGIDPDQRIIDSVLLEKLRAQMGNEIEGPMRASMN